MPRPTAMDQRPTSALVAYLSAYDPPRRVLDEGAKLYGRVELAAAGEGVYCGLEAGGEGWWEGRRGRG